MQTLELKLDGMSCQHCVRSVRETLTSVSGVTVQSVEVGQAVVALPQAILLDEIRHKLSEEGYPVQEVHAVS